MHNRCSKFDMAMVDDKVSRCAVKEVVEEKLRSLKVLQEVQATAIERIDIAFGHQADDMEQAPHDDEQATAPAEPRGAAPASAESAESSRSVRNASPRGRARG
ncbi:unnamed protein product, partial [Prorocentrum cordatum]